MKKRISILFTCLYLVLSIGVAKSTHTCMGEVLDVAFFSTQTAGCMGMTEEVSMPCCNDYLEFFQIEEDHQRTDIKSLSDLDWVLIPQLQTIEFDLLFVKNDIPEDYPPIDPPPLNKAPIYQINCNYTFYG
ncbi:hypothetical protein E1176_17175 [Fulvivirga sp. RKSG066]|uniref:HYC_CC_PP family protein n=1 Tax=Fulvivirga aurantia TaxID=2529383 RepID=UPI0012BB54C9|nr:hypothetical protein [Fulvivirga aurantia]MTI22767.1 hypothetical protein [Fulvivirga aurantia]